MKLINYLFQPETKALDWLWSTMLIYIALGLMFNSPIIALLFLIHILIIGAISMYQIWIFFKSVGEWMEKIQNQKK